MALVQLGLSRTREYDADRAAAELTGDPEGLVRALVKLERRVGRFWEEILLPGRRIPEPSLLRTHPPTESRIRRLRDLVTGRTTPIPALVGYPTARIPLGGTPPRFHRLGLYWQACREAGSPRRTATCQKAGLPEKVGYQARPLRHLPPRKRSPDPAEAGFFRCIRGLCRTG